MRNRQINVLVPEYRVLNIQMQRYQTIWLSGLVLVSDYRDFSDNQCFGTKWLYIICSHIKYELKCLSKDNSFNNLKLEAGGGNFLSIFLMFYILILARFFYDLYQLHLPTNNLFTSTIANKNERNNVLNYMQETILVSGVSSTKFQKMGSQV